ncbi:ankyrin repeat domain-containing protein [uncultured Alcanivorax sp.]|uniref:ankyrin repeat domain-containing protein n=1 Tax=uncultured Alcanivorax sp. TaxID=191215 RepID=UPI00262CF188|nr:ankyrin repeat domain-containing protein [uncultured Alcanivorax sp.]
MYRPFWLLIFIVMLSGCAKNWYSTIYDGDLNTVQTRLDRGADPNGHFENESYLVSAVRSDNEQIVQALLEAGADPNLALGKYAGTVAGMRPLHFAKSAEVVEALVEAGGDPNMTPSKDGWEGLDFGMRPLHLVSSAEEVRALVEAGADPNVSNSRGVTPLHKSSNSAETVSALLEYGADPEVTDNNGFRPVDHVEYGLIVARAEAAKADGVVADHYKREISRLKTVLEIFGRTPITQEQSWEQWPDVMAKLYPDQATSRAMETLTANGTIGIKFKEESGVPIVIALVPQGPAARSKQIQEGDFLIGVAPNGGDDIIDLDGLSLGDTMELIRGKKGHPVTLVLQSKEASQPHQVTMTRGSITREQWQAFNQAQQQKTIQSLVIQDNSGQYLSPYTSDGVVTEWVNKAINNQMGSATGSAVGGVAGAYAANKALESVPGGSLIGGFLGSKAGKAVGTKMADDVSGGDTYRRQTSDLSFRSLNDMASWLKKEHGDKANFAEVTKATDAVYPGLLKNLEGL